MLPDDQRLSKLAGIVVGLLTTIESISDIKFTALKSKALHRVASLNNITTVTMAKAVYNTEFSTKAVK
jgi:hypothetical protein